MLAEAFCGAIKEITLMRLDQVTLLEGVRELSQRDPDLARIVSTYGPPPLWQREPGFSTLLYIILEQQVSLASARAAYNRLLEAANPLTPHHFLRFSDEELKKIGFSRQKTRYGRELAQAVLNGRLDLDSLEDMEDELVRQRLMQVKGIGLWTADIYLLMVLGRPNVWPKGDIALHSALQRVKGLPHRPASDEAARLSLAWQPWRAVAARMLWHLYLSAPKSNNHW